MEAALRKLSAALPPATRDAAERARQRLLVDTADWWQTAPSPPRWLAVVEDAVWRDRRLRLTYGSYGKEPREHEVDPYALVAKRGVWYLVAVPATAAEDQPPAPLVFRISRIVNAAIVDVPSRRPERFDLATFWPEWCAAFLASRPSYWVTLRASAGAARRLSRNFHRRDSPSKPSAVPVGDAAGAAGDVVVEMDLERPDIAMEAVLGYGPDVEVLAPLDFRQEVAARITKTASQYSRSPEL
jgi:predicted DNA-binding transcriptional regulator YafY